MTRKSRKSKYKINGWPCFFLCVVPMLIGYAWIVNALVRAAL